MWSTSTISIDVEGVVVSSSGRRSGGSRSRGAFLLFVFLLLFLFLLLLCGNMAEPVRNLVLLVIGDFLVLAFFFLLLLLFLLLLFLSFLSRLGSFGSSRLRKTNST